MSIAYGFPNHGTFAFIMSVTQLACSMFVCIGILCGDVSEGFSSKYEYIFNMEQYIRVLDNNIRTIDDLVFGSLIHNIYDIRYNKKLIYKYFVHNFACNSKLTDYLVHYHYNSMINSRILENIINEYGFNTDLCQIILDYNKIVTTNEQIAMLFESNARYIKRYFDIKDITLMDS